MARIMISLVLIKREDLKTVDPEMLLNLRFYKKKTMNKITLMSLSLHLLGGKEEQIRILDLPIAVK